jgi:hypothetical protein
MAILSVPPEIVDAHLQNVAEWEELQNTGAGVLPFVEMDERP